MASGPPCARSRLRPVLCAIFFVSGAAALLFETLWFRQAALVLGNSVWASSLVTASFMAGLAVGSALAARYSDRLRRPLLVYALLEALVGVSGALLVVLFPMLSASLAPALGTLIDARIALNTLRACISFALLLLPATAMGLTLPLLARVLRRTHGGFGANLGLLYGFNTLGAVVGALAGEGFLIEAVGVRRTGLISAGLDGVAALGALALAWRQGPRDVKAPVRLAGFTPAAAGLWLLPAAFASGAALLALEVVWFRILQQFCAATSFSFAVMLAVVLVGIAVGGLLAALLSRRLATPAPSLPFLALLAGVTTVVTYANLPTVLDGLGDGFFLDPPRTAVAAAALMLPTALVSGIFFTLAGVVLHADGDADGEAVGLLTLANTCGALLGALVAGFGLLPRLGSELSLFVVVILYGAIALLNVTVQGRGAARGLVLGMGFLYAVSVVLFPFGLMRNHLLRRSVAPWLQAGNRLVALREGLTETVSYTRHDLLGEPVDHRLVVNGFSMSGSFFTAARYMRLFVYLPVALHPQPRSALLISYGVGVTAQALTDTADLESIDVVDISRDVLDLAREVHPVPGPMPLEDPRVRIHLEDGRFFLLTTARSYDLITGEPPPPRQNGVVNLYSKEFFHLVRQRLRPGGIASYWLPVSQLELTETRAIVRAFCDVFEDCSLWNGALYDWVLLGTNRASGPASEDGFGRQWRDAAVRPKLEELGFERPELLGTTFLADSNGLRPLVDEAEPLDDDHPHRLGMRFPPLIDPFYSRFMETVRTRGAFERSAFVRALWPADLRARSLEAFDEQGMINLALLASGGLGRVGPLEARRVIASRLRTPVLWSLGSSARLEAIARQSAAAGVRTPLLDNLLGISALADRRPLEAVALLARAHAANPQDTRLAGLLDLARSLGSDP